VEASLFAARHALGVAMGLPADRILSLPLPSDPFPAVADALPPVPALLAAAVAARADLEAIRQRERSAQTLIVSARDALRPRLDLNLNFGVTGMAEGIGVPPLVTAFGRNFTGPTASASFSYSRPMENNSAKGLLARSDAVVRQTRLQIDDLTRNIQSNVAVAQNDLARSAERVRLFREAGGLYLAAVDDERQKMQLGLATIIDLVLVEDRLTRSRLDEISALRTYAQALARLRYETGTLVAGDGTTFAPTPDALVTIPGP
jgi:outer membrane protein